MFDLMKDIDETKDIWDAAKDHPLASQSYRHMGETSEKVAERFGVSRDRQDLFAYHS